MSLGLLGVVAVARVSPAQAATGVWTIAAVAGDGTSGYGGDGGPATGAQLRSPGGVGADAAGNVYIADTYNHRVRKVAAGGTITTVAGTGTAGYGGDGGLAADAQLNLPFDVAVDAAGNLYIADYDNNRVRKVDPSGRITTAIGDGSAGYGGDGGLATAAQLGHPLGLLADHATGDLYVAEESAGVVRRVHAGTITTVAGNGTLGFSGDGGRATAAQLYYPQALALDTAGNLYIADTANHRVRKVDTLGTITTVAGTGTPGFSGDGGPATDAQLQAPTGVAVQGSGNLFISDFHNNRIRRVDTAGTIVTVAGTGNSGSSGDGGLATEADLYQPSQLEFDAGGSLGLYVAERAANRVRRLETSYLWMGDSPDPVTQGDTLTYTATFSGFPSAATGVKITDTLPSGVSFVSATASQGSCAQAGGAVTCQLGDVAYRAEPVVTIKVTTTTAGVLTNTATVTGNELAAGYGAATQTEVSSAACAKVVTSSTTLQNDVGPCARDGLIVGTDNVTLDLGGHRIFGFAGAGDGTGAGVRLPKRSGVTVRNGTVSGFDAGVAVYGGRANTVTKLTVRDNVGPNDAFNAELGDGIYLFNSAANTVAGNTVVGNGIFDGIGVWEPASDDNRIEGNTVTDTIGPSDGGPAGQGIIINGADEAGGTISNTLVANNTTSRNASAGIANINHLRGRIVGNVVDGNGFTNERGNGIGLQVGPGLKNAITSMRIENNQVHGNAQSGIRVNTQGNTIRGNNAANNAVAPGYEEAFDLHDTNANCRGNAWVKNTWGTGGFSPACTTNGGSGPTLASSPTASAAAPRDERFPLTRRAPS